MNNLKTPVLFLIFNRLDTTAKVFNAIKKAKPSRLYIAADGARDSRIGENDKVNNVRSYVLDNVDWDCEIFTLFREENLGCKLAVSSAIKWFFSTEDEGIVLEDDCLPSESFFTYCSVLLEKYRYDDRVRHISGTNVRLKEQIGDGSYYFTNFTNVWGWASWSRVWKDYDANLSLLNKFLSQNLLSEIYKNKCINNRIAHNLKLTEQGKIDTWDYQYLFLNFYNNGLCIFPNVNLIKNIGFGIEATHTQDKDNKFANLEYFELCDIIHPTFFVPIKNIDERYLLSEVNQNKFITFKHFIKMGLKRILGNSFFK